MQEREPTLLNKRGILRLVTIATDMNLSIFIGHHIRLSDYTHTFINRLRQNIRLRNCFDQPHAKQHRGEPFCHDGGVSRNNLSRQVTCPLESGDGIGLQQDSTLIQQRVEVAISVKLPKKGDPVADTSAAAVHGIDMALITLKLSKNRS